MKKLLYRILKKDIVKKLRNHHYGEQFVDDVMKSLGIPTNYLQEGLPNNGSWWKK